MKSADRFEEILKEQGQNRVEKVEIFIDGKKVIEGSSIMAGVVLDKEAGQLGAIIAGNWSPNEASELIDRLTIEFAHQFAKGGGQREDN